MIKKETLRMIKDRVTESINGLMEMYITVINIYIYKYNWNFIGNWMNDRFNGYGQF